MEAYPIVSSATATPSEYDVVLPMVVDKTTTNNNISVVVDTPTPTEVVVAAAAAVAIQQEVTAAMAQAAISILPTAVLLSSVVQLAEAATAQVQQEQAQEQQEEQQQLLLSSIIPSSTTTTKKEETNNDTSSFSLVTLLEQYCVELDDSNIPQSLENLHILQTALQDACCIVSGGNDARAQSPGFFTVQEHAIAVGSSSSSSSSSSFRNWNAPTTLLKDYETRNWKSSSSSSSSSVLRGVPISSPAFALQCCRMVEDLFHARLAWSQQQQQQQHEQHSLENKDKSLSNSKICSCIGDWEHTGNKTVLYTLVNQGLEQLMTQEASDCITTQLLPNEDAIQKWNDQYYYNNNNNGLGLQPSIATSMTRMTMMMANTTTPLRLLRSRDDFISTMIRYCLLAEHTIQISTCYLFVHDPAQRYILLDLLPYIIQNKPNVKIQLLLDLMTIEGAVLKSGFYNKQQVNGSSSSSTMEPTKAPRAGTTTKTAVGTASSSDLITSTSFVKYLQNMSAPVPSASSKESWSTPLHFIQHLLQIADLPIHQGRFQIQWWCARDATYKYRIKNHAKCTVIDRQVAIWGGSNLAPTLESATSDLDILVSGPAAAQVANTVDLLWSAMEGREAIQDCNNIIKNDDTQRTESSCSLSYTQQEMVPQDNDDYMSSYEEEKKDGESVTTTDRNISFLEHAIQEESWSDSSSSMTVLRSQPSSKGEDCILRAVLQAVQEAQDSILICMGHCNIPPPMVYALRDATEHRNVHVKILINSIYSCDLRCGQRDLFLSVRDLLQIAPKVEVYATASPELRQQQQQQVNEMSSSFSTSTTMDRPPFLHAKYVVIDGYWSAVGSWNLWTRGAFFELEHEAIIHSKSIALELTEKFEEERNAHTMRIKSAVMASDPTAGFCPKGCSICKGFGPFYQ